MLEGDFFDPKTIAVIGASAHPEKIGFSVLKNIIDGGFLGKIFPVNPDADNILGLKCYPNVLAIPSKVDFAVIIVPADIVAKVLDDCGKKKIKFVIIISAGFSEVGPDGVERQEQIEKIAKIYGIRVLGPNCLGLIDPVHKLNISFATNLPEKKNIGVISQSGATCTAILDWANHQGIGFSTFVSLGNKIDLNENDFLDYFTTDAKTKVVIGYLESFSDGQEFLEVSSRLAAQKPVILLKAGRSNEGQKAASSHTGALAGDDLVVSVAFEQAGVIRANTTQDLFEWAQIFSEIEMQTKNRVQIITNAGGPAVMAVDQLARSKNLEFYNLTKEQKVNLRKKLPLGASINNPLDLLGDATSERFELALKVLKNEPDYKLILLTPQSNTDIDRIADLLVKNKDERTVVVLLGGKKFENAWSLLSKNHIPVFAYPERAVLALDVLAGYCKKKAKTKKKEHFVAGFKKVAEKVFVQEKLSDSDIAKVLMAYNIPMANSYLTISANEAIDIAEKIGYPVVLKVTSPDILHKTEYGAVKLGIKDEKELRIAYQEVLRNAKKHAPKAKILGVTVYKMFAPKIEAAIGARRDPIFGPVIMFGLGGIYIELLKDFQLSLGSISTEKALEMIQSIKSFPILNGYRNGEKYQLDALAKAISGLSALMEDFPEIEEVDINPLNLEPNKIMALDAKIIFEKARDRVY